MTDPLGSQEEWVCLTCGCRVRPSGHPGNMCRAIAALRDERNEMAVELHVLEAERDELRETDAIAAACRNCGITSRRMLAAQAERDALRRLRNDAVRVLDKYEAALQRIARHWDYKHDDDQHPHTIAHAALNDQETPDE